VAHTKKIGTAGEQAAQNFLEKKGYRFITANWQCKLGEVDLIMQHGSTRVFVEVRTRQATTYGSGADTVAYQKQHKLLRTARFYQQKEGYWDDLRFDVISITLSGYEITAIEHIEHAFSA